MTKPTLTRRLIVTPFTNAIVEDGNVYVFHGSSKEQDICCEKCSFVEECRQTSNGLTSICLRFRSKGPRCFNGYFKKVNFRLNMESGHIEGKA